MAKRLLPDALWDEIAPLFPPEAARPIGSGEALTGILFVLYTAIGWERLPFEVADCSGMTCWRRLRAWQDIGLRDRIHRHMLDRLNLAGQIDWSRRRWTLRLYPRKGGATRRARTLRIAENPAYI